MLCSGRLLAPLLRSSAGLPFTSSLLAKSNFFSHLAVGTKFHTALTKPNCRKVAVIQLSTTMSAVSGLRWTVSKIFSPNAADTSSEFSTKPSIDLNLSTATKSSSDRSIHRSEPSAKGDTACGLATYRKARQVAKAARQTRLRRKQPVKTRRMRLRSGFEADFWHPTVCYI